jgi:hypothetical protein
MTIGEIALVSQARKLVILLNEPIALSVSGND